MAILSNGTLLNSPIKWQYGDKSYKAINKATHVVEGHIYQVEHHAIRGEHVWRAIYRDGSQYDHPLLSYAKNFILGQVGRDR